jgi:hypothetical protein
MIPERGKLFDVEGFVPSQQPRAQWISDAIQKMVDTQSAADGKNIIPMFIQHSAARIVRRSKACNHDIPSRSGNLTLPQVINSRTAFDKEYSNGSQPCCLAKTTGYRSNRPHQMLVPYPP